VRHEADRWLVSLAARPVPPRVQFEELADRLGRTLPSGPEEVETVIERLITVADDGLTAIPSGRFFGFVMGGTHPAALAADWLVSLWDQNHGMARVTPASHAVEVVASAWLLDLLGLPADAAVGYVTGGTMANFTCLAAARGEVLRRLGWDVSERGLVGSPGIRVLVGAERHDTIDLTLRYLGLGRPVSVAADAEGRLDPAALEAELSAGTGPAIVCLQAGNVHSGAFDPFVAAIEIAHRHGAWVHVDGAFGLFSAASATYRPLAEGMNRADSWATDAHKTLNVPYDCGVAIVRDRSALRSAMSMHGDYLMHDAAASDPLERVPELSRRARALPVWAVLASLGRSGVADLVDGFARHAASFAEAIGEIPDATILNDVVFTQVCVSFGSDERTRAVVAGMLADGEAWMTGSTWRGRAVLRISVTNWSTTDDDVQRGVAALKRVVSHVPSVPNRVGPPASVD
jgi:glutamate/tyrosine decarboxylase-like PLP-dependent enzyme